MPKLEEGDILLKQREDGLLARLKMFINLRQELERVSCCSFFLHSLLLFLLGVDEDLAPCTKRPWESLSVS